MAKKNKLIPRYRNNAIMTMMIEVVADFKPKTSFERIQCAFCPDHPMTLDYLSEDEKTKAYQYQEIYILLVQKNINNWLTKDIKKAAMDRFEINEQYFWVLLSETKSMFNYNANMTRELQKSIQLEQWNDLWEMALNDYASNKNPLTLKCLIEIKKEIDKIKKGGIDNGIDMEGILGELRIPEFVDVTDGQTTIEIEPND